MRNVRTTNSGVYKWEKQSDKEYKNGLEYVPDHSGRVLLVGLLLVAAIAVFILTHI